MNCLPQNVKYVTVNSQSEGEAKVTLRYTYTARTKKVCLSVSLSVCHIKQTRTERSNTAAIWWLIMAHSYCTGPGLRQNWETMGFYITLCPVQTTHGQGQETLLPPAKEVWGKVIFLHLFVILFTEGRAWLPGGVHGCRGVCVVGGCAWLLGGMHGCWGVCGCQGVCMVGGVHGWGGTCVVGGGHAWLPGGMHGCRGACVVARGGHVWLWGACMVVGGHAWLPGGHAWLLGGMCRIRRDTVNERVVHILLECILVFYNKIIIVPVAVPVSVPVPFSVPVPCNVYEP